MANMERRNWWFCTTRPLMMNNISWWLHSLIYSLTGAYFDLDFNGHSLGLPSTILCPWQVDTQDEAIKTLTSAKERLEKEKYKLGKSCFVTSHYACLRFYIWRSQHTRLQQVSVTNHVRLGRETGCSDTKTWGQVITTIPFVMKEIPFVYIREFLLKSSPFSP